MGGFMVFSDSISQDQDFKEENFSINSLLVSEWNVPVKRI